MIQEIDYLSLQAKRTYNKKTTKIFGGYGRNHYLCINNIVELLNLKIMKDIVQKDDLRAFIQSKIYVIRGQRVMLDFDLAAMYGVETRRLNEQVKRNIERFPEDFMFQLTKGEMEILRSQIVNTNDLISQNATSKISENQLDENWKSQNATSNFVRMGLRKSPFAFTENGVAMLSSILRSPLAIQVNIGIMRAFTEFRKMATSLPNTTADVAQLRKDFEELKLDIEDILHDQNDINESTRLQLEAIDTAILELQVEHRQQPKRKPIGFIQPKEEEEDTDIGLS